MTPQRKHEIAPFTSTNTNNLTSLTDGTGYRDIFTDQLAIPVLKHSLHVQMICNRQKFT